ncbi:MAG: hypothetical protein PVH59_12235, partial [Anaerolineae bacterium]
MNADRSRSVWVLLLIVVLVLAGCGGGSEPTEAPTPTEAPAPTEPPAPTEAPTPTEASEPTATPDKAVSSLEGVKSAVIQIEAQGSFVEPGVGLQMNVAGRGSGFIIDESGIAVTNNHVVTGAAFLQVWVGGEDDPLNAKVVAVSECSDLAL